MIGVSGITGVPEPTGPRVPGRHAAAASSLAPTDELDVSVAALNAARLAEAVGDSEIREALVAEARERIAAGTHKLQSVVTQVAARLSKFVD